MPWYLYLAFKQLFPTGRFFSFFSLFSIIGVMLGVMVLLIVQSVMNGFGHEIRKSVADFNGDIRVMNNGILYNWEEVEPILEEHPDIEAYAPYAGGVLMLQHGRIPSFPTVKGADPFQESAVVPMNEYLLNDGARMEDLDDDGIFLSVGLARSIGAYKGSRVEVYTPLMLERMQRDEILLPRELEVLGIYETGYGSYDSSTVVVSLRLMQEMWALNEGIHGFAVRVRPGVNVDRVTRELNGVFEGTLRAISWLDTNRDLLFILGLEKTMMFFVMLFIILVASFSITISLSMSVIRKTREIGLLVAMGARPRTVALGFLLQGLIIGVLGAALGVVMALIALHFRNEAVQTLARLTNSEEAFVRFYQFSEFPVQYLPNDFIVTVGFTILLTTLAGFIPAIRAGRLKPADALRNE